jgi:hypothetical protein
MFDQTAQKFVHYPIPVRSDTVKTTIAANGGVWFQYRNAGKYDGYGGTAVVLYPDKNSLETMASYPAEWSNNYALGKYKGAPSPKVVGGDRISPDQPQNPGAYDAWAEANDIDSGEKTVEETKDMLDVY